MRTTTRLLLIWAALMALTLLSFETRDSRWFGDVPIYVPVITVGMIKVRFVVLDFMEVRNAPMALRLVLEGWILCLATVLIVTFD